MGLKYFLMNNTDGRIVLTFNRPEKLNAVTHDMGLEFREILQQINEDHDSRVLIITGAGKGFCSGADVSGTEQKQSLNAWTGVWERNFLDMRSLRRPIIGAINGVSAGLGFSLAMACDIRIASEQARFTAIFVRRALGVDCGLSYVLPRIVGLSNAFRMMYTGEIIDAQTALGMGLVSEVVPAEELLSTPGDVCGAGVATADDAGYGVPHEPDADAHGGLRRGDRVVPAEAGADVQGSVGRIG